MTITEPVTEPGGRADLVARVRGILLHPTAEWSVIDREPATVGALFTRYACILALIPPIATVINNLLVIHWGAPALIVLAVLGYITSLAGAFVLGFIIDALAPTFDGQKNLTQAMKLSVYSATAGWVGGIFDIVPIIGPLLAVAAAIYGLYILYRGLPLLMRSPPEKTAGYFVVVLICAVLVWVVFAWIVGAIAFSMVAGAAMTGAAFIH